MAKSKNHVPSDAMSNAAARGVSLAKGAEAATLKRANDIAGKKPLTSAAVKRIHDFHKRHSAQRPAGSVDGSSWHVAHLLRGGDAGKVWAQARMKQMSAVNADEHDETVEFAELFFADDTKTVQADDEGLIWKPMLPAGTWTVGPNGKPLKVVAGSSPDQHKAIGIQDIYESFNAGAVAHVTIPKSHDDRVDENTGYIRKLKIDSHNGIPTLFGGHHFTDKEVAQKVLDGSIANTSVGLEFDYQRKEDGKKFPIILRHNALTNRPWLGSRLAPFGIAASDDVDYEVKSLVFAEPPSKEESDAFFSPWDDGLTLNEISEYIEQQLDEGYVLEDVAYDRALVKHGDKNYVLTFSVTEGEVTIADREQWVEQNMTEEDDAEPVDPEITDNDLTSSPVSTIPEDTDEGKTMDPKDDKKDEPQKVETPVSAVSLADLEALKAELAEQKAESARIKADNDKLARKNRENEAAEFVDQLRELGFTEEAGCTEFLKKSRNILLSDEGEAAIMLSEDGEDQPKLFTPTSLIKDLLASLPTDEKTGRVKVALAEQQTDPLRDSTRTRPKLVPDNEMKFDEDSPEFKDQMDALFDQLRSAR